MGTLINDLHAEWSQDETYVAEYNRLGPQYDLAAQLIAARVASGLSQADVAMRMGTKQSAISRIEGGQNISVEKLRQYAAAIGKQVTFNIA